jgi:putative SOS response-associated peptidase YedK
MCGRFTLKTPVAHWLADLFPTWKDDLAPSLESISAPVIAQSRYNIAPTQNILVVRLGADSCPILEPMRWGLLPSWADTLSAGYNMINARSESIADKPSFRPSLISKRCVVLADGYYEWKTLAPKVKEPYWIHTAGEHVFAMAGIWAENRKIQNLQSPDIPIRSVSIATIGANEDVAEVHDRMPAIKTSETQIADWLNPALNNVDCIPELLEQLQTSVGVLRFRRASTLVNRATNEGPEILEPLS